MKKLFAGLLLPVFLTPLTIISTEQELVLTKTQQFDLLAHTNYFTELPKNPRLYSPTMAYQDEELSQIGTVLSAEQPLKIDRLVINDELVPVFELASGEFLPASQLLVFDDQELSREVYEARVWLKKDAKFYDRPLVFGAKPVKAKLTAFQEAKVTQVATTYSGTYYQLEGQDWVEKSFLYESEIDTLQALLSDKYNKPHLGIYVKRLDDGSEAGVNQDKRMYGASVAKLATIYDAQRQVMSGQVKLTDKVKYIEEVNAYSGSYDPMGTGRMSKKADNKEYSIEDLLKALTQYSDNVASNMLGYYVSDRYGQAFNTRIKFLLKKPWNMKQRDLSAETAGLMMEQLYLQDGQVLDYLSDTAFDKIRISKDIDVKVAHKTGDADEFRHDVAIIYADRPFVLSVFTENASDQDITSIANDVYKILK